MNLKDVPERTRRAVERMLFEGLLGKSAIARRAGLPQGVVSRIAQSMACAFLEDRGVKYERCPTCLGLVKMPCRLCYIRKIKGIK